MGSTSNSNLKAIAECTHHRHTEVCTFLGLVGHYRKFIKGFTHIAQPLSKYLARQWVSLTADAMKAFEALKQACMTAPVLVFADYTKTIPAGDWCIQRWIGVVLSQKHADGWYHSIAYGSRALMPHKKNYHSTKLEFLALKWAVTEHFKEYLSTQSYQ